MYIYEDSPSWAKDIRRRLNMFAKVTMLLVTGTLGQDGRLSGPWPQSTELTPTTGHTKCPLFGNIVRELECRFKHLIETKLANLW